MPATKELVKQCQEEFQGLGKFPGEHHIYIDPEAPPVVQEKERFPWPCFRFKRLPFGLKSSSEVFQQKNSEAFGDISGVNVIADDLILEVDYEKEHT